jgi:hypothetical protein
MSLRLSPGAEKANPGKLGTTTSNASHGSGGSVSRGINF